MLIGYCRLSDYESDDVVKHENELRRVGCRKIFMDTMKPKSNYRPSLMAMFDYLRDGDVVVVEEFRRLTRGVRDLLYIVGEVNEKRADIRFLDESLDTTTEEGFRVYELLVELSDYEKKMRKERRMDSYFSDVASKKTPGRKPAYVDGEMFAELYEQFRKGLITRKMMVDKLGISLSTIKRYEKEYCKQKNMKEII